MLRLRLAGGLATLGLLIGGGMALRGPAGSAALMAARGAGRSAVLEVFYTPPVLVRTGERVRIPVDVICATTTGLACRATLEVGFRVGGEAWRRTTVSAVKGLRLDMTGPATRAVGPAATGGRVEFYLRATDASGRTASLGSERAPLAFYVAPNLPAMKAPAVPFGRVRAGRTILSLPWGSGPAMAGLQPGLGSATLGPSGFDVDAAGRIYLSDALQGRVAVFAQGRLVRQTSMPLTFRADVAAGPNGEAFVADRVGGRVTVRTIDPRGRLASTSVIGEGAGFHLETTAGGTAVNLLPADQWLDVAGAPVDGASPGAGMPVGRGARLIRLGTEAVVRLGTVIDGKVRDPVEIRSAVRFGEVALCQRDGAGGYVVVVHTWRARPNAADQYQLIRIANGSIVETFGIANSTYTETPPLSRFRLGGDGALYQLVTTSSSMDIVRFELGRER